MSLLGIDVGTSAVKAAVFSLDGVEVATVRAPVISAHPHTGAWTVDAEDVWSATVQAVTASSAQATRAGAPVSALAISAAGRECFAIAPDGSPLTECVRSGDIRGAQTEAAVSDGRSPRAWIEACGHVPDRRDPVARWLWWSQHDPEALSRAALFGGWHEWLTLRLTGTGACDPSLAGHWLAYRRGSRSWDRALVDRLGLDSGLLPTVVPAGTVVGRLRAPVAAEFGLPLGTPVAAGGFDGTCAALGVASDVDHPALLLGTWQVLVANHPQELTSQQTAQAGLRVLPSPITDSEDVHWLSPNGSSVLDWVARVFPTSTPLDPAAPRSVSVAAMPDLAGPAADDHRPWEGGALTGLTLSSVSADVHWAFVRAIAEQLNTVLHVLSGAGGGTSAFRATGGGMSIPGVAQSYADIIGHDIDVVRGESGAFGAALLAGAATGVFSSAGADDVPHLPLLHTVSPRLGEANKANPAASRVDSS